MNETDMRLLATISNNLKQLEKYFYKFNKDKAGEALCRACIHAYKHYDKRYGELIPYLKALARTIMCITEEDEPIEEIEQLAIDTTTPVEDLALEELIEEDVNKLVIREIMLPYMTNFLTLGELFEMGESVQSNKIYFSQSFKTICVNIMRRVGHTSFTKSIIYLYKKYKESMLWFLEQDKFVHRNYVAIDYATLNKNTAKRIFVIDDLQERVYIPDRYRKQLYVKGASVEMESIAKIRYIDLLYQIEVLSSTLAINALAYIVDGQKILRTCGGSEAVLTTDMDNVYELNKDELIMNILTVGKCRLLATGYDYLYVIKTKYSPEVIELKGLIGIGDVELYFEPTELKLWE